MAKFIAGSALTLVLTGLASMAIVGSVHAQCTPGFAGGGCPQPPAPSGGGGEKQRRPTKTPSATPRPTATPTATLKTSVLMPLGGGDAALTATYAAIQTYTAQTQMALTPSATSTPSPLTRPIVTPVAGPLFLLPGQIWMIILVVLVALGAGALILVVRNQLGGAGNKPPSPNLTDDPFMKESPFDKDFHFDKDLPGGNSPGGESGEDLTTRFIKWTPGDGPSGPGTTNMGD